MCVARGGHGDALTTGSGDVCGKRRAWGCPIYRIMGSLELRAAGDNHWDTGHGDALTTGLIVVATSPGAGDGHGDALTTGSGDVCGKRRAWGCPIYRIMGSLEPRAAGDNHWDTGHGDALTTGLIVVATSPGAGDGHGDTLTTGSGDVCGKRRAWGCPDYRAVVVTTSQYGKRRASGCPFYKMMESPHPQAAARLVAN
jgi:hypothetical protein